MPGGRCTSCRGGASFLGGQGIGPGAREPNGTTRTRSFHMLIVVCWLRLWGDSWVRCDGSERTGQGIAHSIYSNRVWLSSGRIDYELWIIMTGIAVAEALRNHCWWAFQINHCPCAKKESQAKRKNESSSLGTGLQPCRALQKRRKLRSAAKHRLSRKHAPAIVDES